ncbi:hypothetical protein GCM10022419_045390 [Nonomuraea rosea]|uniref:Helix-turn-helix domain-containing protein n=1 Tax=Nonomuraea rosea TaxID=638574 RepID=A0ABP6X0W3_9ACTN
MTAGRQQSVAKSREARAAKAAEQLEDYLWLREQGEGKEHAAARVGVSYRQAQRWEAVRRQQGAGS